MQIDCNAMQILCKITYVVLACNGTYKNTYICTYRPTLQTMLARDLKSLRHCATFKIMLIARDRTKNGLVSVQPFVDAL